MTKMEYTASGIPSISVRSSPSDSDITSDELQWMRKNPGFCPDCGGHLLDGPCGGGSQNFLCNSCLSKFNAGGFWIERIGKMLKADASRQGITPLSIGISVFAQNKADPAKLLRQVRQNWINRKPGTGRTDIDKVVLVPISPEGYALRTVEISEDFVYDAYFTRRAEGEDPYIAYRAIGYKPHGLRWLGWKLGITKLKPITAATAKFVHVVCYSAESMLENNGKRTGDFDWEVVAVLPSNREVEPMEPLTMARNMLQKPGGTFAPYTQYQVLEAVYYHSRRVVIMENKLT